MIGRLTGRIGYVAEDHALLDVGGVGYVVYCASRTLAALPRPGEAATLYTDLLVREDLLQLFGFASPLEREWHRLLTRVQGVGAKVSLSILGALGPEGVSRAIALEDSAAVRRAPGVGPKLALRIVAELKDRAPGIIALGGLGAATPAAPDSPAPAPVAADGPLVEPDGGAATADALSALVNLGYGRSEAAAAVARSANEGDAGAIIRAALKRLAPKE